MILNQKCEQPVKEKIPEGTDQNLFNRAVDSLQFRGQLIVDMESKFVGKHLGALCLAYSLVSAELAQRIKQKKEKFIEMCSSAWDVTEEIQKQEINNLQEAK